MRTVVTIAFALLCASVLGGIADKVKENAQKVAETSVQVSKSIADTYEAVEEVKDTLSESSLAAEYEPSSSYTDWSATCDTATGNFKARIEAVRKRIDDAQRSYENATSLFIKEATKIMSLYGAALAQKKAEIKAKYDQKVQSVALADGYATIPWCESHLLRKGVNIGDTPISCDCIDRITKWDNGTLYFSDGHSASEFEDLYNIYQEYSKLISDNGWILTVPAIIPYPNIPK